jgi:hypothetical protein
MSYPLFVELDVFVDDEVGKPSFPISNYVGEQFA